MPARASGGPSHSLQALAVRPRADELQPSSPRGQYEPGGLRHGHFQPSLRDKLTWCRVFSLPSSTGVPHAKGSCVSSLMNKSLSVHPPHLVGRLGGHGGRVVRPGGRQCGGSVSRRFMPGAPVCIHLYGRWRPLRQGLSLESPKNHFSVKRAGRGSHACGAPRIQAIQT